MLYEKIAQRLKDQPLVDPIADDGFAVEGRRALITGGGHNGDLPGVGYATARLLGKRGAQVVILDRSHEAAQRTVEQITAEGGTAYAITADVTSDEECEQAVAKARELMGGIDILVNNVAAGDRAGIFEVNPERFQELLDINLKSTWYMTRHAVPFMPSGSSVVNISSVGVSARGPGMPYSVAKAGVENFTEGAATTLGPQGIRVNCVQVGAIWGSFASANMDEKFRESRREMTTLKKEGSAWDIAHAAAFLASDQARWITGHILAVDGGPFGRGPAGEPVTTVAR